MALLSAKQIGRLRTSTEDTLLDTGLVYRRALTRTDSGGVVNSAAALVETTACRLLPIRTRIADSAGAMVEVQLDQILVPVASTVLMGDEIHVGTSIFKVTGITERAPGILKCLDCTRL